MFRTFGYSYVFDASAQPIREQLANPLVETPALQGVRWRIGPPVAEQTQLLIVVAPLQCFLAVLRLCDDPEHAAAVMLPPPSVGMSFYDGLAENQPRRIQRFCTLSLPDGFLPLTDVWNYVLSQDTNETKSSLSAQINTPRSGLVSRKIASQGAGVMESRKPLRVVKGGKQ